MISCRQIPALLDVDLKNVAFIVETETETDFSSYVYFPQMFFPRATVTTSKAFFTALSIENSGED